MNDKNECLSEIEVDGEQFCMIQEIFERIPPACNRCGLLRFCEEPRSMEQIEMVANKLNRIFEREDFFEMLGEMEYFED